MIHPCEGDRPAAPCDSGIIPGILDVDIGSRKAAIGDADRIGLLKVRDRVAAIEATR